MRQPIQPPSSASHRIKNAKILNATTTSKSSGVSTSSSNASQQKRSKRRVNVSSRRSHGTAAKYPYSRNQECSWQPEEVARHLSSLCSSTSDPNAGDGHGHGLSTHLLSHGWLSHQVSALRQRYGNNRIKGDAADERGSDEYDDREGDETESDSDENHRSSNSADELRSSPGRARRRANAKRWRCRPFLVLGRRLGQYGLSQLNLRRHCAFVKPIAEALLSQFKEPLILMLLGSAAISVILGNTADAASIAVALLIVALVAAIQEYRSEAALERLANLVPHTCTVLRDGKVQDQFLARDLVVGDLVLLATGDRVPADCRVVDSVELMVDESSLTGENHPVAKFGEGINFAGNLDSASLSAPSNVSPTPTPPLTEQHNIVFAGTLVHAGRGRALVVAVGDATEFGKVASELSEVSCRKSPLQNKMDELGQRLAFLCSSAIAVIALVGWLMGRPFLETVTIAVSLAVAAIPEGLPICVTVTLALGVLRMARRNAIIKRLPIVESLGCTTVVASDKTGTLTQNEMTVRAVFCLAYPNSNFSFTGVGYSPSSGKFVDSAVGQSEVGKVESLPALAALFHTACLCNNATLVQSVESSVVEGHTGGTLSGQPTELALLVAAAKAGILDSRPQYHRVQEIPFSSERKRMEVRARPVSGLHLCQPFQNAVVMSPSNSMSEGSREIRRQSMDGSIYFIKGMTEKVLEECQTYVMADGSFELISDDDRAQVLVKTRHMASLGLRVLALAFGQSLGDLCFVGLVAMEDPPREGVAECVHKLRQGGVNVMMVTGDSKETALAIAHRCGIMGDESETAGFDDLIMTPNVESSSNHSTSNDIELGGAETMSGEEIDAITPHDLADSIVGVKVFYRVVPRHKLSIVRALQQQGEIVIMTGDGVNDSLSLKGADIGVAMGKKGTDVAKEAADVVLADDDFRTITMAIAEGKGIFFNIRCFLAFQLSTSFAALTMESIATLFGLPTPLNAMQILWINIIMDGPPAQSLGVEPVDEHILRAKPRKADDPIVTRPLLLRAVTSAALIVYLTLKVFANELDDGRVSRRDTTMTFMTFVNCDLFNAYVCRSSERCFYELSVYSNPFFLWAVGGSIVGQLLVIYWSPLQEVFQTEALSLWDLGYIILLSSTMLVLDTLRKVFFSGVFSDGYNATFQQHRSLNRNRSWLNLRRSNSKAEQARSGWGGPIRTKSKSTLAL